jgi:DNA mismatch endonuclease (patch repair protein)
LVRTTSGVKVRPDVVFTKARIAVFVDGCFWHSCPRHATSPAKNGGFWQAKLQANVRRDRSVDRALTEDGWRLLRIWEHEDPDSTAGLVKDLVDARRHSIDPESAGKAPWG